MNLQLTDQIIRHILNNVGVNYNNNNNITNSIISKHFILPKYLKLQEENSIIEIPIYGTELLVSSSNDKIQLLLCNISQDIPEYLFLVRLNGCPPYAAHLLYSEFSEEKCSSEPLIAYYFESSLWTECTTYMQATFLAGMEQLKDINIPWKPIVDSSDSYKIFVEFFEFCENKYQNINS